jgi:hypothetical protein
MRALPNDLRRQLESAVVEGRRAAEVGARAALLSLGVPEREKPAHLDEAQARLRRGLRAKQRQLGGEFEVLVWDAAYEQWHRLLFARFLAENRLLRHPQFDAPVTLAECEELAEDLWEPDGWSVAARFAAEILPGIFRLDDPCVQVRLAPEHRVALEKIVEGLPADVFAADDSLGWVYQYWQSERKAQVNASEVKIGGADLGPVTQLFTENYMVRFLLENSLGAWWAARRPDSPLLKDFEFLRFDDDGQPAAGGFQAWPDTVAEVTVMDPCCGSGHFLVEAFGMLWRMRAEEEDLNPVAAQDAVLTDNLFGLELDPRCVQIAMFAVALTAWKQGGGWRELPTPNIACSGIPAKAPLEEWTALTEDKQLRSALERLHKLFRNADTLGSFVDPRRVTELLESSGQSRFGAVDFNELAPLLEKAFTRENGDSSNALLGADAAGIARAADLLSRAYDLVVTNPPYLDVKRQSDVLAEYARSRFSSASRELAVSMMRRCAAMSPRGSYALVTPATWTSARPFKGVRESLLNEERLHMAANLGSSAFEAISGEVVKAVLLIASPQFPSREEATVCADVAAASNPSAKARALMTADLEIVPQQSQLENPHARLMFVSNERQNYLQEIADGSSGIQTGDNSQFQRFFWEFDTADDRWLPIQRSATETKAWTGLQLLLLWESGQGRLHRYVAARLGEQGVGSWIRGIETWGRSGIALSRIGDVPASLYMGGAFSDNTCVITPKESADLPLLWAFCSSEEFTRVVRSVDQRLSVTLGTFLGVPLDVDRWRAVAAEEYPGGLPEPWSDDPSQWLFEGRPAVATEPLQVGLGRLLGYRWPEQPEPDDLSEFADKDGIVCLPAVGGEAPAADRLTTLLSSSYGDEWSPGLVRRLLKDAGSRKKSLGEWLRDEFFKHHCKVFSNRPFVWHIWDGRKDGFSALVNYHRLNRAGLEKLTYSYLGDWIERQRADASEDVAGADVRLAAARELKGKLEAVLEGEPPFDIFVRWKELHEQPIGWNPDLDDGVRLNIRPFVEAGVLRSKVNVHWKKDRGTNPDGSERHNDLHFSNDQKRQARQKAGSA